MAFLLFQTTAGMSSLSGQSIQKYDCKRVIIIAVVKNKKPGLKKQIYTLMLGHLSVDINQGALPAALPFLIAAKGLNYTSATGLVFASNITASIVQPLFGYLGDRSARFWVLSLGILLTGSGFAMIGLLDNYWAIFIAVMVSGVGSAIFHPEGGRLANQISDTNKGANMSVFAVGGSLAFAVGPLVLSSSVTGFGIRGTSVFFIPAFIMAAVSLTMVRNMHKEAESNALPSGSGDAAADTAELHAIGSTDRDDWPAFVKLSVFVFFRSTILAGLSTFIPLYWVGVLMQTQAAGSIALSVFSFAAVFSTLVGGFLADRIGYKIVMIISAVIFVPFLVVFTFVPNLLLSFVLLIPMGFVLQLCFSPVIATGQAFVPRHIGFASGITMGMGVSVGGITAPILGRISDLYGLTTTFHVLIALACITAITAFIVPGRKR